MDTNEEETPKTEIKVESRLEAKEDLRQDDEPNLDIKSTEESPQLGNPAMDDVAADDAAKKTMDQENEGAGAELKRVEEDISLKVLKEDTKISLESDGNREITDTPGVEKE